MKLGLEKLQEAAISVKELSVELVDKEKELEVANVRAEQILTEVSLSARCTLRVTGKSLVFYVESSPVYALFKAIVRAYSSKPNNRFGKPL